MKDIKTHKYSTIFNFHLYFLKFSSYRKQKTERERKEEIGRKLRGGIPVRKKGKTQQTEDRSTLNFMKAPWTTHIHKSQRNL